MKPTNPPQGPILSMVAHGHTCSPSTHPEACVRSPGETEAHMPVDYPPFFELSPANPRKLNPMPALFTESSHMGFFITIWPDTLTYKFQGS